MDNTALNAEKLPRLLDKLYRFGDDVMALREYLARYPTTRKSTDVQVYTLRKVHLCYEKLASPKTHYLIWHIENGREVGIEIPKLVWDTVLAEA